ncbi:hypothetical protein [Micromonospora taraxaci]
MSQQPIYVQQRSGCGRILLWLLILFVGLPVLCCVGQTLLGLFAADQ